jgi:hypothetical protein
VSELQEMFSKQGITPNYEFVQKEGPGQATTYQSHVTVLGMMDMYED